METELMTIKEIAQMVGCTNQWIYFLVKTRQLRSKRIGNQYLIKREDAEKITVRKK